MLPSITAFLCGRLINCASQQFGGHREESKPRLKGVILDDVLCKVRRVVFGITVVGLSQYQYANAVTT